MKLITVATHNDGYFKWLKESCKRYNYDLVILGYNEKWKGFNWRLELMINYLKSLNDNEIICFIDAYDIIMLNDSVEMKNKFIELQKKKNCKMIISLEIQNTIDYLASIWKFGMNINAGSYIGYKKDILYLLNKATEINNKPEGDDQELMVQLYNKYKNDIYIDSNHELFLPIKLSPVNRNSVLEIDGIKVYNNELYYYNKRPFLLHVPFNGQMDDIIKALGYELTDEEIEKINKKSKEMLLNKFKHHISHPKNIYTIIFIITIIISIFLYVNRKTFVEKIVKLNKN